MKVGFVSRFDPLDKKTWSGINYYTYQQIRQHYEVEIFNYKLPKYLQEWLTTQKSLNRKLFGKHTSVEFLKVYAKYFSKKLEKELKKRPVDVLYVSASSQLIAYLETAIPIIYMTDATFQQLQGYYPLFSNLASYNIRQGIELDKLAFQKASHIMLSSEWSKKSAVEDYGIDSNKISIVHFGANMDNIPSDEILNNDLSPECRILFLGVEWERKGGDLVIETFKKLIQKKITSHLYIIGCIPPVKLSEELNITVIPFLDKNSEKDFQELHSIFLHTDFLLLPTKAECTGVVFSEASAYGIPTITSDTGGVSSVVKNGVNGYALPLTADADAYAELIATIFSDKTAMQELKKSSRVFYGNHLNWSLWGKKFKKIVALLVK